MSEKNIYQKMSEVSEKLKYLENDMTVGSGNYAYKGISDSLVMMAVNKAEREVGIVSIPIKQELVSSSIEKTLSNKGEERLLFIDTIKMTTRFVNLENKDDYVDIESYGKGVDYGDKGLGKASTYARKYGALNGYKIGKGEDPDAEKSVEINTPKTPDEKLTAISNYFDKNVKALQDTLKHFNVAQLQDLTKDQVEVVYNSLVQKKLL